MNLQETIKAIAAAEAALEVAAQGAPLSAHEKNILLAAIYRCQTIRRSLIVYEVKSGLMKEAA